MYPHRILVVEVAGSSSSQGVAIVAERLIVIGQRELTYEFEMKDIDLICYFLGLVV